MKSGSLLILCLILLPVQAWADEASEVFGSYTLGIRAGKGRRILDLSLGGSYPIAPDLALRWEYGYARSDLQGDWYTFQRDEVDRRERRNLSFQLQSLALGAQYSFFSNALLWGSLLYAKAPGTITVEGQEKQSYKFSSTSISSQFGVGYRWRVGKALRLGVDFFVIPVYLWKKVDVGEAAKTAKDGYSPRHEIGAALHAVQDARALRAVVGFEF